MTMREGDVGFDGLAVITRRQGGKKSGNGRKAANVFIGDPTFEDIFSLSIAIEK